MERLGERPRLHQSKVLALSLLAPSLQLELRYEISRWPSLNELLPKLPQMLSIARNTPSSFREIVLLDLSAYGCGTSLMMPALVAKW
eukprot:5196145-Amphidinium_carterae.1